MNTKMNKVIIYTNETCNYCKQVKKYLKDKNIEFEDRLTKDYVDEWTKITNFTGVQNVPRVVYKNNYFAPARDFHSPQHLENIIDKFKEEHLEIPSDKNQLDLLVQHIKTLNFNIAGAFRNLDQILKKIEQDVNKSTD